MPEIAEELKKRKDVPQKDRWNIEALFPSLEAWQKEFELVCRPEKRPHWPELSAFQGKLGESPKTLKDFFNLSFDFDRKIGNLFTYAHMRYDEDLGCDDFKKVNMQITAHVHEFMEEFSWVEPEILGFSKEKIHEYLQDPVLENYRFHLKRIFRMKEHTLSKDKEELLAMAGKALSAPGNAFNALNNADLRFPSVQDEKGNQLELTHAKYMVYMRSKDRQLRKNAFLGLHSTFISFENTIGQLYKGHLDERTFITRARKYKSNLETSLFPNQIDLLVYSNLIQTVRENISILHEYIKLRKNIMGIEELHPYDLYVPLVEEINWKYDFETAVTMVISSVAPLGKEYQEILHKGLKIDRWVDRYENLKKRSGAYSCGSYDSMPYILMNFQGTFTDLMTLAHEAGHSMHSYFSKKNQPYQYSDYSIFLAEVASTFNEELMFHYLMQQKLTNQEKAFLINQKIEDIRATFFRQAMFAEFELQMHTLAEKNVPLTSDLISQYYRELNAYYLGTDLVIDKELDIEWARIPHFYSNFYVYQYATGISAAHAFFEKVVQEKNEARDAYLQFLSSGSSNYPLDLLEHAGVNMRQKQPIEATLKQFERLVKEFSKLM